MSKLISDLWDRAEKAERIAAEWMRSAREMANQAREAYQQNTVTGIALGLREAEIESLQKHMVQLREDLQQAIEKSKYLEGQLEQAAKDPDSFWKKRYRNARSDYWELSSLYDTQQRALNLYIKADQARVAQKEGSEDGTPTTG